MRFSRLPVLLILGLLVLISASCKKNQLLTNGGSLRFSADTLLFDTVFTTLGSATYKIKIYNAENQPVKISSVRLDLGTSSPFRINVNGIEGNEVRDQELAPHDSLYVFAIVTVDPNSETSPFLVTDRLTATMNGKDFSVPVVAYGQNAHYLYGETIKTTVWDNRLPYVILNNALVDTNNTLTIEAGTRIYLHADSRLFVSGTLITNGTKEDSIVFQGNRIDRRYFSYLDLPGEWGGIYFSSTSSGSRLNWTIIKNAGRSTYLGNQYVQPAAVQIDQNPSLGTSTDGQLVMNNCIIQNSIGYGILSFGGSAKVQHSMIQSCGAQNLGVFLGGHFDFNRCTFATYGSRFLSHADAPVMSLLNYFDTTQTQFIPGELQIRISNSIIYGTLKDELICNAKGDGRFDVVFDHCLIKAQSALHPSVVLNACKLNEDPQFTDYAKFDFHLKEGSPALNAGSSSSGPTLDNTFNSNIGAY